MKQEIRRTGVTDRSFKIYLFCCSSSFDPVKLTQRNGEHDDMKVVPLPCSGKMDILYLTRAFETGADGVVVVTCKHGECRYLEGNLRARKRAEAVNALLEETGIGIDRVTLIEMDEGGIENVIRRVDDFRARLRAMSRQEKTGVLLSPAS